MHGPVAGDLAVIGELPESDLVRCDRHRLAQHVPDRHGGGLRPALRRKIGFGQFHLIHASPPGVRHDTAMVAMH